MHAKMQLVGPSSQGETFFREIQWPLRWVPAVRWRNHYFARNMEAFPCVRPWTQLLASPHTIHFRWMSFVDHVDHSAPSTFKVVDEGKAPYSNEPEMGRRGNRVTDGEVYEG